MDRPGDLTVTLNAEKQQLFDRLGPLFEAESPWLLHTLEEQLNRFAEIVFRLLNRIALARDVELRAERDVTISFRLDDGG
jgi:hypothetical protein